MYAVAFQPQSTYVSAVHERRKTATACSAVYHCMCSTLKVHAQCAQIMCSLEVYRGIYIYSYADLKWYVLIKQPVDTFFTGLWIAGSH